MFKKRYLQIIALSLLTVFSASVFSPPVAMAHHYYRHHRHHGWSSGDTWRAIAGVGILAYIASRASSSSSTPEYHVIDYDTYKANFIRSLDSGESALWLKIKDLEPGEYFIKYDKGSTARRIKKFCENLPCDFEYVGVDEKVREVYFNKLQ